MGPFAGCAIPNCFSLFFARYKDFLYLLKINEPNVLYFIEEIFNLVLFSIQKQNSKNSMKLLKSKENLVHLKRQTKNFGI